MQNIDLRDKTVLVTGGAGFIGAHLIIYLLKYVSGIKIISMDNLNDYYDVKIKRWRLEQIDSLVRDNDLDYLFIREDISNKESVASIFEKYRPSIVVNLAAQAGVRYSITNPESYIESNVIGFFNILEACRHSYDNNETGIEHLIFASSSSIYGTDATIPFSTDEKTDEPVSLYAATKKSNELMAYAYSKLYNIPITGLRFFSVYGPAGRPDMAYFKFTDMLRNNEKIRIFNFGECKRDFTFIDDVVEGLARVMAGAPTKVLGEDGLPIAPFAIYNIGNQNPENLLNFVDILQQNLIKVGVLPSDYNFEEHKELVGMQPGDVPITWADSEPLMRDFGFRPKTRLQDGLEQFAIWYKNYYCK